MIFLLKLKTYVRYIEQTNLTITRVRGIPLISKDISDLPEQHFILKSVKKLRIPKFIHFVQNLYYYFFFTK